uniref:Uncharacterized protein n=1 Tax=Amphimedon queenslandica TaxID=400682 RepID=A0A1X7T5I4_AMPQE
MFTPLSFNGSTGEVTLPSEYIGQFTAVGEIVQGFSPTRTFQTNFTLLNFTREFDLAQILCGIRNPNENFVYTIGLPVAPSLLPSGSVQTREEGSVANVNLQGGSLNAFPPTITSSQLSLNGNSVFNTGVTVNDYNVSFTNVQRNQSGIYTLTAPITCTDYPVIFYSLMLRVQYSSNNISLMIPVENTQLHDSKSIVSFSNGSIEYDEDYMVSIAAVNDVGVSEASPERRIITSSLQSISASLHGYQLRIICHFANGSLSTGCFVIVALANETELMSDSIIRPQLDSLTSNTTITLTMDHLHLSLVVIGGDYNNAMDTGLVRITATPLLISGPADPNDTVITNTPTSITAPTTSVTASISTAIINTPTTTPQTSGLSSGAIAGITISIFILLTVVIILIIIIILQCLYFRK